MLVGKRDEQPAHSLAVSKTGRKNLRSILKTSKVIRDSVCPPNDIHAIAVDVVHGCLWFQGAGVDPEEDQWATLLFMKNLEGQGTQVILVPAAADRRWNFF